MLSEFDAFAPFYDLEHGDYDEDLPFYEALARRTGSPLLEIGCGTGRLLVPLAVSGFAVTGVDISSAMLSLARAKADKAGVGERVHLVQADARDLHLDQQYAMAFISLNTFTHFLTRGDQLRLLESVRRHLQPGGILIIDLFNPAVSLARNMDGQMVHDWIRPQPEGTGKVIKYSSTRLDEAAQKVHVTWFYQVLDSKGNDRWTVLPFSLRYLQRSELELLLERSGFRAERVYGSYELDDFSEDSPRLLALARPAQTENRDLVAGV